MAVVFDNGSTDPDRSTWSATHPGYAVYDDFQLTETTTLEAIQYDAFHDRHSDYRRTRIQIVDGIAGDLVVPELITTAELSRNGLASSNSLAPRGYTHRVDGLSISLEPGRYYLGISLENAANAVATVGSGSGSAQSLGAGLYQRFPHDSWILRSGDHLSFELIAPDEPPVAADDAVTTAEDAALVIPVTANDQEGGEIDPATTVVTAAPENGSLVHHGDGTFTYTPAPDFHGTDQFAYQITGEGGLTDNATVSIEVTPQRDVFDDSVTLAEDSLAAFSPLANDTFADPAAAIASFTQPPHGSVTAGADGMLFYTPDPDYYGQDTFTYTVAAGADAQQETGTVSVTVTPRADVFDDSVTLAEDSLAAFSPLANDAFADPAAAIASFTQPQHGSVTAGADGMLFYTPNPDYYGDDAFTYTVAAGADALQETGTVSITVNAVNDPPRFAAGSDQRAADGTGQRTVESWATQIGPGPENESHQRVSFVVTVDDNRLFAEPPAISPDGTLRYTAAPGASGTALVRVVAVDDGGTARGGGDTSSAQTFTIALETTREATIDVKKSKVPLQSRGRVPIEILSTERSAGEAETLDATLTDLSTLKVNGVAVDPVHAVFEDVDGDGDDDLVVHFRVPDLVEAGALDAESVDLVLTAELADGTQWRGGDEVSTKIPPGHHGNGAGNGKGPGNNNGHGRGRP